MRKLHKSDKSDKNYTQYNQRHKRDDKRDDKRNKNIKNIRRGGKQCSAAIDCQGLGYGDTCQNAVCSCTKDSECRGVGRLCIAGKCQMRPSCGVGRFCPVGFTCSGTLSGQCVKNAPQSFSTLNTVANVTSACAHHPVICGALTTDALQLLASEQTRNDIKKRTISPTTLTKIRRVIVALIVRILEDPHDIRDLLVRLQLRPDWLACAGLTDYDLDDPDRFDDAVYRFLTTTIQVDRKTIEDYQRNIRSASIFNKSSLRNQLVQYLDEHVVRLEAKIQSCGATRNSASGECAVLTSVFAQQCPYAYQVTNFAVATAPLTHQEEATFQQFYQQGKQQYELQRQQQLQKEKEKLQNEKVQKENKPPPPSRPRPPTPPPRCPVCPATTVKTGGGRGRHTKTTHKFRQRPK